MSPGVYDGGEVGAGVSGFLSGFSKGRARRGRGGSDEFAANREERAQAEYERNLQEAQREAEERQAAQRGGIAQAQQMGVLPEQRTAVAGSQGPELRPEADIFTQEYFPRMSPTAQRQFLQDHQAMQAAQAEMQAQRELEEGRASLGEELQQMERRGQLASLPEGEAQFFYEELAMARDGTEIRQIHRHLLDRIGEVEIQRRDDERWAGKVQHGMEKASMLGGEQQQAALDAIGRFRAGVIDEDEYDDDLVAAETGQTTTRRLMREMFGTWRYVVDSMGDLFAYEKDGSMSPEARARWEMMLRLQGLPTLSELEQRIASYRSFGPEAAEPGQRRQALEDRAALLRMRQQEQAPGGATTMEPRVPQSAPTPAPGASSQQGGAPPARWTSLPEKQRGSIARGIVEQYAGGGWDAVREFVAEQNLTVEAIPRAVWREVAEALKAERETARGRRTRDAELSSLPGTL